MSNPLPDVDSCGNYRENDTSAMARAQRAITQAKNCLDHAYEHTYPPMPDQVWWRLRVAAAIVLDAAISMGHECRTLALLNQQDDYAEKDDITSRLAQARKNVVTPVWG